MILIGRVYLGVLLCLAILLGIFRSSTADCLRLPDYSYDFVQVADLNTGRVLPGSQYDLYTSASLLRFVNSPDNAYLAYFQRGKPQDGYDLFDLQLKKVNQVDIPRVLYRDLPEPYTVGSDYRRDIVDVIWLPDSRHLLLYWLQDFYAYYRGSAVWGGTQPPITQSIHHFVLMDVEGRIIQQRTLALPLMTQVAQTGILPFQSFVMEGISADGTALALRHSDGLNEQIEMWSLPDLLPIASAPPIDLYAEGCYQPYESSERYCVNWSPKGNRMAVIGRDFRGDGMLVIHDFDTGQRHLTLLPSSFADYFLIMPWSPDGEHVVVTRFYERKANQLLVDREGKRLADLPDAAATFGIPRHRWTATGNGLLYYVEDEYGYKGRLYLIDANRIVILPDNIVNEPWLTDEAWRGSQIAVVWNEDRTVHVGVLDTLTGSFKPLFAIPGLVTVNDWVRVRWLSDNRIALTTNFAFAWGNTDGTNWHAARESLTIHQKSFAADSSTVLVTRETEDAGNVYRLHLDTAEMQPLLSPIDATQTLLGIEVAPGEGYVYRLLKDASGEQLLQVLDTLTGQQSTIHDAAIPIWDTDSSRYAVITNNAVNGARQLRVFAASGELLQQVNLTGVDNAWHVPNTTFGKCY